MSTQAAVVLSTELLAWQEFTSSSSSPLIMLMVTGSARRLHLSRPPHSLTICEVISRSLHLLPLVEVTWLEMRVSCRTFARI